MKHKHRSEKQTFLYMVPVEMSTLMSILPIPGRTDWKYPRPEYNVSEEWVGTNIELTKLETRANVLGLAVREEGADVEWVRQAGLHANDDVEGLNNLIEHRSEVKGRNHRQ
jgi:hypothetical protein